MRDMNLLKRGTEFRRKTAGVLIAALMVSMMSPVLSEAAVYKAQSSWYENESVQKPNWIINEVASSEKHTVCVTDVKNVPIPGVKAVAKKGLLLSAVSEAPEKTYTTDGQGKFQLDDCPCTVTFMKDGYQDKTTFVGQFGSVTTETLLQNQTSITSAAAEYAGKKFDLLNREIHFSVNPGGNTELDQQPEELVLNIKSSSASGNTCRLVQGTRTIAESKDGVFRFQTYNKKEKEDDIDLIYDRPILLDGFREGEDVDFEELSQDGKSVICRQKLGVVITKATSYAHMLASSGATWEFGSLKFKTGEDTPLIGETEFDFSPQAVLHPTASKFFVSVQHRKVQIGFNLKKEVFERLATYSNAAARQDYNEAIKEATEQRKYDKIRDYCNSGTRLDIIRSLSANVEFCMFGEVAFPETGIEEATMDLSGNVHLFVTGSGSIKGQAIIYVVPVYFKVGLDVSGGVDLKFAVKWDLDKFDQAAPKEWLKELKNSYYGLYINAVPRVSIGVELGGGIGVDGILSVGGGGAGSIDVSWENFEHFLACYSVDAFLEAYISPFFHGKKTWHLASGVLYENPKNYHGHLLGSEMERSLNAIDYENLSGTAPAAFTNLPAFSGNLTDVDLTLDDTALRGNSLRLIPGDKGTIYAFYFRDEDSRNKNGVGVVYEKISSDSAEGNTILIDPTRLFSATPCDAEYTEPAVASPSTASSSVAELPELYYDVCKDGDRIYIAAAKADRKLSTESTLGNTLEGSSIYTAVMDVNTGKVTDTAVIPGSKERNVNLQPVICRSDGKTYVAWISVTNDTSNIFSASSASEYEINLYDSVSKTVKRASAGTGIIHDLAIGKTKNGVRAVCSIDRDKDLSEISDTELYSFDGSSLKRLTDNDVPDISPSFLADGTFIWMQNGKLMESATLSGSGTVIASESDAASNFTVFEGNGKTMIVWEGTDDAPVTSSAAATAGPGAGSGDNDHPAYVRKTSVYAVEKTASGWSRRFALLRSEDYLTSSLAGYIDQGGINLLHTDTDYILDDDGENVGSALILNKHLSNSSLDVLSCTYDAGDMVRGKALPLKLVLRNSGSTTVSGYGISVNDEEICEKKFAEGLKPGEERTVTLTQFEIPADLNAVSEYTISARPLNRESDSESVGHVSYGQTYTMNLGYTDLSLSDNVEIINDEDYYVVEVSNRSCVNADGTLTLRADTHDGPVLYSEPIKNLEPGMTSALKVRIKDLMTEDIDPQNIYASVAAEGNPEVNTEDNTGITFVGDSTDLYRLIMTAGSGGTVDTSVEHAYRKGSEVSIQASPYGGMHFERWDSSVQDAVEDRYSAATSVTIPGEDVAVKAVFARDGSEEEDTAKEDGLITGSSYYGDGNWEETASGRQLRKADGTYAKNQWAYVDGHWYVFGSDGIMRSGWQFVNGMWYYLDPLNGDMKAGWLLYKGKWYYLDLSNGDMKTGLLLAPDGYRYYFRPDGSMATGDIETGGTLHHFNDRFPPAPTYAEDPADGTWKPNGSTDMPYGAEAQ